MTPEERVQEAAIDYVSHVVRSGISGFRVGDSLTMHMHDFNVDGVHWEVELIVKTKLKDP